MARFLLLPGSKWQLKLAEKIKEKGHWLCVVSPEEDPPCASVADIFFKSDIFAIDKIEKRARELCISAIITDQCDIAMPVVAELAERLNIKLMSCETAALFTDKYLMREFGTKYGIKSPEYKLCKTSSDAIAFQEELGKPIIIKPLDSNSSHGVFKVCTAEEIKEHFNEALSFSRVEKFVLAERYIEGTEFTLDGIKTPKGHYSLAISEKKHFEHNPNIADELYFTHYNSRFDYSLLTKTNNTFVNNSPLEFGFTHAEYKYEDGGFYLIEIGARGGGNMISSVITQHMSGFDTYSYLIDCAAGNVADQDFSIDRDHIDNAAILKFFKTPNHGGVVAAIEGLDYLDNEPDIKEYQLNFNIGDSIEDAVSDSARIGFYIACAESAAKIEEIKKKVDNKFKIILCENE